MISSLISASRIVAKRLVADWLIVTAAFITIVLAAVLLASGPIYADAVTISALRQTLADAPPGDADITVEITVFPEYYDLVDELVRNTVNDGLSATGADTYAVMEAEAYGLDDHTLDGLTALASFQYLEAIDTRAILESGKWPSPGAPPHEMVLSTSTATALGLDVGDLVPVSNRRDSTLATSALVAGIYRVEDRGDPYWQEDPLVASGFADSASFRTYGPMVVSIEDLLEGFTPGRVSASWRVFPRLENLTVADVNRLIAGVAGLELALNQAFLEATDDEPTGSSEITVQTGLPELLAGVDRSLAVTRSSVLALLVQFSLLAGYALVLTSGLLADTRLSETRLLRSRGASPRQILGIGFLEGVAITVPAVLLSPFVATALLRILNVTGPLASVGMTINPRPTVESYALAVIAAVLSILILTVPAYRSARNLHGSQPRRRRQQSRSGVQRFGIDIALLTLAAIAFWQLQVVGDQIGATVRGRFGVDPLLIIAPALGLVAGAVLALRVIPLMARLGEWIATSSRATVSALASWQVARRPVRYSRAALLLMMAIAVGFFAASFSTIWATSQQDQATHAVGADITVMPDTGIATGMPDLHLTQAHQSIVGVEDSMALSKTTVRLRPDLESTRIVLLDASKADEIVRLREDLGPDFGNQMAALAEGRPEMASVAIPGEPTAVGIELDAVEEPLEIPDSPEGVDDPWRPKELAFDGRLSVVIQDGNGLIHRLTAGDIPVNEGLQRLTVDLTVGNGLNGAPAYPLEIINLEIRSILPLDFSRSVELTFASISALEGGTWSEVPVDRSWDAWELDRTTVTAGAERPDIYSTGTSSSGDLQMEIKTGRGFELGAPVHFSLRPAGTSLPETVPIVVSESLIEADVAEVGGELGLRALRVGDLTGIVVGTFSTFPSADRDDVLLIDLPTLQRVEYQPGDRIDRVGEYWLSAPGDHGQIVTALKAAPLNSRQVSSVDALTDTLISDPAALGTVGALTVGFVAAAVFAAVGFAVSAAVSARERLVEFALLRAIGLSPRQLGGWLSLEQGVLVVLSLVLGTFIGVVLTVIIVPVISLTQDGSPAQPGVIVTYPWNTIIALEIAVIVIIAVIVTVMIALLRRVGLGSLLRLGED